MAPCTAQLRATELLYSYRENSVILVIPDEMAKSDSSTVGKSLCRGMCTVQLSFRGIVTVLTVQTLRHERARAWSHPQPTSKQ